MQVPLNVREEEKDGAARSAGVRLEDAAASLGRLPGSRRERMHLGFLAAGAATS